mgnify:CR=1 FL=1
MYVYPREGLMPDESTDLVAVQAALAPIESGSQTLRWAAERPWRTQTHVWTDHGIVTIDLHDLNASWAKKVVDRVAEIAERLDAGGVVFVTGRGRHSIGVPVLRQVVGGRLVRFERKRGWRQRDIGSGRMLLVVNEERIPKRYREGTPLWIAGFFVAFVAAAAWSLPVEVGVPLLAVAGWFTWAVRRAYRSADRPVGEE